MVYLIVVVTVMATVVLREEGRDMMTAMFRRTRVRKVRRKMMRRRSRRQRMQEKAKRMTRVAVPPHRPSPKKQRRSHLQMVVRVAVNPQHPRASLTRGMIAGQERASLRTADPHLVVVGKVG